MFFRYFDKYYWLLIVPAALIALWAQIKVKTTFARYSSYRTRGGQTAASVARMILDRNGLYNVKIERIGGHLSDHFDPRTNVVRLSDSVYSSSSIAAIGVAAHECGHAVQYSKEYFPMKIRAAMIPITNIGSSIGMPLAIFGIIFSIEWLSMIGIVLFTAVTLFQLVTLPVELDASYRAINTLRDEGILEYDELYGAKKVLTAAALTYVAALVSAIASLLRLILLRRDNDN